MPPIHWDKPRKRWRFEFNRIVHGQRVRATKLLPAGWSRARADAFDRSESGGLYAQALGQEKKRHTINDAVRLFLDHKAPALRHGRRTAQELVHVLPFFNGKFLDQLPEVAREYILASPHLAPATVRNRLAYLRAACRYAYKHHGLGEHDPAERMVMPRVRNERQFYVTPEQLDLILAKCPHEDTRAVMRIAFYTGMRWVSELLKLTQDDIKDGWIVLRQTKTGRPRMVPVHPEIAEDLKRLPFPEHNRTYYKRFKAAAKAAGFPQLVVHDLRHSLASNLISRGATLYEVGTILGHASPQSMQRYSHLYPQRMEQVIRLAGRKRSA